MYSSLKTKLRMGFHFMQFRIALFLLLFCMPVSSQDTANNDSDFINIETAPASVRQDYQYSELFDGYVTEEDASTIVYRRHLDSPLISGASDGDAIIMDMIENSELGTITFEQDYYTDGIHISFRPQVIFNERGRDIIPSGLKEYFLLGYEKIYGVTREEAEDLLANNTQLPISWQTEFTRYAASDAVLSPNSAEVRYIKPQSGVSFVLIDQEFQVIRSNSTNRYPALYVSFFYSDGSPGYTFGVDAESNGRLILYIYAPFSEYYQAEDSLFYNISISGRMITGVFDTYKLTLNIIENPERIGLSSAYHTGWNNIEVGSPQEQIRIAFNSQTVDEYDTWYEAYQNLSPTEQLEVMEEWSWLNIVLP